VMRFDVTLLWTPRRSCVKIPFIDDRRGG